MVDDVIAGTVVDRSEMLLGDAHTDAHGETLAQRPGGDFHAVCFAILRMTRGDRAILAELLQIFDGDLVAGQVQYRVEHRRRMAVGQHKAIAIAPLGVGRVVAHEFVKEEIHGGGIAQRRPGVPALCLLYGIHGEKPQRIDGQLIQFTHKQPRSFLREYFGFLC